MHMADALLSPAVGVTLWAGCAAVLARCARKVRSDGREDLVARMGVLGAFVFAAMMINFTIPGTGSSGHIGGALLLSVLLGPHAALVVMASVLTVQALFFADGGLLALGANIVNVGVFPCFVGYALIYRPLRRRAGSAASRRQLVAITVLSTVVGSQLGALGVVLETQLSGISSLPLASFLWLMQPIHLAIGLMEGLATAALVAFVHQARPDLLAAEPSPANARPALDTRWLATTVVLAALTAGVFSWFASTQPDGLEWSIARIAGAAVPTAPVTALHRELADVQKRVAVFPDYRLATADAPNNAAAPAWPAVDATTSLAGVVGGAATLALVSLLAYLMRRRSRRAVSGAER